MASMALALLFASASVSEVASQPTAKLNTSNARAAAPALQRALIIRVDKLAETTARATVIRRPVAGVTQEIILVTRATTAHDLAKAISTLIFSRNRQGASVTQEMRAHVPANPKPSARLSADERRAGADLKRLSSAKIADVQGVGRGPAIAVSLAPVRAARR
jgi:hypothetical protein